MPTGIQANVRLRRRGGTGAGRPVGEFHPLDADVVALVARRVGVADVLGARLAVVAEQLDVLAHAVDAGVPRRAGVAVVADVRVELLVLALAGALVAAVDRALVLVVAGLGLGLAEAVSRVAGLDGALVGAVAGAGLGLADALARLAGIRLGAELVVVAGHAVGEFLVLALAGGDLAGILGARVLVVADALDAGALALLALGELRAGVVVVALLALEAAVVELAVAGLLVADVLRALLVVVAVLGLRDAGAALALVRVGTLVAVRAGRSVGRVERALAGGLVAQVLRAVVAVVAGDLVADALAVGVADVVDGALAAVLALVAGLGLLVEDPAAVGRAGVFGARVLVVALLRRATLAAAVLAGGVAGAGVAIVALLTLVGRAVVAAVHDVAGVLGADVLVVAVELATRHADHLALLVVAVITFGALVVVVALAGLVGVGAAFVGQTLPLLALLLVALLLLALFADALGALVADRADVAIVAVVAGELLHLTALLRVAGVLGAGVQVIALGRFAADALLLVVAGLAGGALVVVVAGLPLGDDDVDAVTQRLALLRDALDLVAATLVRAVRVLGAQLGRRAGILLDLGRVLTGAGVLGDLAVGRRVVHGDGTSVVLAGDFFAIGSGTPGQCDQNRDREREDSLHGILLEDKASVAVFLWARPFSRPWE